MLIDKYYFILMSLNNKPFGRNNATIIEDRKVVKKTGYRAIKEEYPLWQKSCLTVDEAAVYSGIGKDKLRELTDNEDCSFVLWNGTKRLIKRRMLDAYIDRTYSI